jgi:hypothetical protein
MANAVDRIEADIEVGDLLHHVTQVRLARVTNNQELMRRALMGVRDAANKALRYYGGAKSAPIVEDVEPFDDMTGPMEGGAANV